jgi:hypothetical protein
MLSTEARRTRLDELFHVKAAAEGEIAELLCEEERTESYRDEGATSTESWVVERYGVATSTARALTHVGTKSPTMPKLIGAVRAGEISFDKIRAVADVATLRSDGQLLNQARRYSVRELAEVARTQRGHTDARQDRRFCRFNDTFRTVTVQLPPDPTRGRRPWTSAAATPSSR